MLSDEQRKRIEQAIDGKATTRPAWAAQDIAEKLYPLIEGWIGDAVDVAVCDALEAPLKDAYARGYERGQARGDRQVRESPLEGTDDAE